MTLLEPDVTLTDYGLTVECAVLAWLVWRRGAAGNAQCFWFVSFFGALGMAALLGGTVHGFIAEKQSNLHVVFWSATLLAIGWAALSAWAAGGRLVLPESKARRLLHVAAIVYVAYAIVVVFVDQRFGVAIVHYLPATVFLLATFIIAWRRERRPALLTGAFGMVLTFIAAGVQQARIGLHPVYFNHNALYHLIQALALILIFLAAYSVVRTPTKR